MKVTVISMQAIMAGRDEITWTGETSELIWREGSVPDDPAAAVNEHLFRFFNRVDERDERRLQGIGYSLPSLSVGDVIYWNRKAWRVAGEGFRFIDPDDLARASLFDTFRPEPKT
jgi:hypothetical protein